MTTLLKQPSERFWTEFVQLRELTPAQANRILYADESELCCCFEYAGDNPNCKIHGKMYPHPKPQAGPNWELGSPEWFEDIKEEPF